MRQILDTETVPGIEGLLLPRQVGKDVQGATRAV